MMKWIAAVLLLFVADMARANETLPRDVYRYVDRRMMCNHWAGEEAYDAARRAQINKAVRELRCTTLARDERKLLRRYRHDPALSRRIQALRDAYPE